MDINPDQAVNERYTRAARQAEAQLCYPVEYDEEYLKAIPREVIERDYGCGNPTPGTNGFKPRQGVTTEAVPQRSTVFSSAEAEQNDQRRRYENVFLSDRAGFRRSR